MNPFCFLMSIGFIILGLVFQTVLSAIPTANLFTLFFLAGGLLGLFFCYRGLTGKDGQSANKL
mgnify:CR=1 FL=1